MNEKWRSLTRRERELIEKLLSTPFAGREELVTQLEGVVASKVLDDGTMDLRVESDAPRAGVTSRVPVEAQTVDADGMDILILLHVVDGMLNELEIIKGDDTAIIRPPVASELSVQVRL